MAVLYDNFPPLNLIMANQVAVNELTMREEVWTDEDDFFGTVSRETMNAQYYRVIVFQFPQLIGIRKLDMLSHHHNHLF
jgi:hypothetical protein